MAGFEVVDGERDPAAKRVVFGALLVAFARGKRESARLARQLNGDAEAVRCAELITAHLTGPERSKLWLLAAGNVIEAKMRGCERSELNPQEVAVDWLYDRVRQLRGVE